MNKFLGVLLLSALLLTGCVTMPLLPIGDENKMPPVPPEPPPPPAVVLPEQVTPQNANAILESLKAEIDYESRK